MGAPPNWLLWIVCGWYVTKLALFLFVLGAKCWDVTFGVKPKSSV